MSINEDRRGDAMKLAPLTLCTGVLVVLSATYAAASPAYVTGNVNMRSGPATTNDIVTKIPGGSLVEANNCKDGWCEVTWQGKNGFTIQTSLDMSGRVPSRPRTSSAQGPVYSAPGYYPAPGYVEAPPPYYYGPRYYGGPYWRRRYWY
jgi:uncharacterized protein YraI